jgi:hypothetical protein
MFIAGRLCHHAVKSFFFGSVHSKTTYRRIFMEVFILNIVTGEIAKNIAQEWCSAWTSQLRLKIQKPQAQKTAHATGRHFLPRVLPRAHNTIFEQT